MKKQANPCPDNPRPPPPPAPPSIGKKSSKRTRKQKAIRKKKRELVGYDDRKPDMCKNCNHFEKSLFVKSPSEYFPPRCKLNEFAVNEYAVCNKWDAKK